MVHLELHGRDLSFHAVTIRRWENSKIQVEILDKKIFNPLYIDTCMRHCMDIYKVRARKFQEFLLFDYLRIKLDKQEN